MKKTISIIIVILLVIVIVMAVKSLLEKEPVTNSDNISPERQEAIEEGDNRPEDTLNVKRQHIDGTHTFVGTIILPTPCNSYNAEVVSGNPAEIKITINELGPAETCIAVTDPRDFKVSYQAPFEQEFIITINGTEYNLNLFEVPEDENIDTVELYIKG
jgi:hypothetical protein